MTRSLVLAVVLLSSCGKDAEKQPEPSPAAVTIDAAKPAPPPAPDATPVAMVDAAVTEAPDAAPAPKPKGKDKLPRAADHRTATPPKVCIGGCGGPYEEPCDKPTIRRYLKHNMAKINYCYEKQLLASPGLAGTVDTRFTIGTDGVVKDVLAKGVSEAVASCVADVIGGINFPKPKSGATCIVTSYPFAFAPVSE